MYNFDMDTEIFQKESEILKQAQKNDWQLKPKKMFPWILFSTYI